MTEKLLLAVPSKGRLMEQTIEMFAKAGLTLRKTGNERGYRGEIAVSLVNHDPREPVVLHRGDRIAQLVVQRVEHAVFHEVEELPGSDRGEGGFGSSGR